jgi:hypothetical protein
LTASCVFVYSHNQISRGCLLFFFPQRDHYNQGGPPLGQDEKTYKATDIKLFIVPQGVQLIGLSFPKGKVNITKYAAGSYQVSIPDVKGQYIITTTDK